MGGQMQQSNAAAAAAALYDPPGGNAGPTSDAGDAVMARWLQSAGLQHLASPLASSGIDHRLLPNLLMQEYGAQSAEEKQKLFKLLRKLNMNGEPGSEPYTPTAHGSGTVDGFYSPELRWEFGTGLLDLYAMDDTELLTEHVIPEPFEPSPFMSTDTRGSDSDFDVGTSRQQRAQAVDSSNRFLSSEKEVVTKENNLAKIKVVVRKRPSNKKELSHKEECILNCL